MASDPIRYDLLTQQALRGVVRSVLAEAAKKGLPGEHNFYITFDTRADGVKLSDRLRAQYPEEMTIILQHQFWDLTVNEERFEVGLSFGGIPERLIVPFETIKSFFDPSVQFGLQFAEDAEHPEGATLTAVQEEKSEEKIAEKKQRAAEPQRKPGASRPTPVPANPHDDAATAPSAERDRPSGGAEVLRLDRFRKK
ncbi:MAG: ClpXP protease specificity-enhancing factor SspB [Hyphomicrobiales bacterium]